LLDKLNASVAKRAKGRQKKKVRKIFYDASKDRLYYYQHGGIFSP
jgi:hypothetical protein